MDAFARPTLSSPAIKIQEFRFEILSLEVFKVADIKFAQFLMQFGSTPGLLIRLAVFPRSGSSSFLLLVIFFKYSNFSS
jgi:hypothetical protein